MQYEKSEWNGFERLDFQFEGKSAILILPRSARADGKWLFKTEYFGAFPSFELAMLERGYYVANVKNATRWRLSEDTERQASFCKFLQEEFGLSQTCMPVGMSCGGMQAVYLAASYPHLVSAMYLDAPVLNLLSCPCRVGRGEGGKMYEEFVNATGRTVTDLINDRNQPIDCIDRLIEHKIPVALVCGAIDTVVPYPENGAYLSAKYRKSGLPFMEVLKPDCDHHPHGLEELSPLLEFAGRHYN